MLIGQTGSRKSTQLSQFLDEAGCTADGRPVAICEPRRIPATCLASRVAAEAGWVLGEHVGYAIRFEDLTSKRTCIQWARPFNTTVESIVILAPNSRTYRSH